MSIYRSVILRYVHRHIHILTILLAIGVLLLDWRFGSHFHVPILYILPVLLASWAGRPRLAITVSVVLPLARAWLETMLWKSETPPLGALNMIYHMLLFLLIAFCLEQWRNAAQQSRQQFTAIVDAAEDAIIGVVGNGTIQTWNQGAERLFGMAAENMVGQSIQHLVVANTTNSIANVLNQLLNQQHGSVYETAYETHDGTITELSITYFHICNHDGTPLSAWAIIRDITERKRTERALRMAEHRYRTLIEQLPAVVYLIEYEGGAHVTYISPQLETLLGYTPHEWLTDYALWSGRIHPEDQHWVLPLVRQCTEDRRPFEAEYRMLTRDDQVIWVHTKASLIRQTADGPAFSIGVMYDVTQQKQIEQQKHIDASKLQQLEKLQSLGVLSGGIAHEFNNLLTVIMGNAELALHGLPTYAPSRFFIQELLESAHRAAEVTSQILVSSGKSFLRFESVDLSVLVGSIDHLLRQTLPPRCTIDYSLCSSAILIEADTSKLTQLVLQLVANAAQAVGNNPGAIHVATGIKECSRAFLAQTYLDEGQPAGRYGYLEVADTGIGMNLDTQARLFDPFFTSNFVGRGLGLAMVLGIVRGHHGAISVDSTPQQGTGITIFFPLIE